MSLRARLTGFGSYLPKQVVTNAELAERIETSDEWIRTRTGISQRHIAGEGENAVTMAAAAARSALAYADVAAESVDAVIVATATPDQGFPATAVRVQAELGMSAGFAFDITAACSGFVYALSTAEAFIRSGQAKKVLVIGTEVYSRIMDWEDRTTCVLFGDGAGAVLVEASDEAEVGILSTHLHSDGTYADLLYVDGPTVEKPVLHMQGRDVFRHAVAKLSSVVDEALAANGLSGEDIAWLVPHQPISVLSKAWPKSSPCRLIVLL